MTIHRYPADPHTCIRAAERDITHYVELLAGDGVTDGEIATAAHYIRVAARARRLAREQLQGEREREMANILEGYDVEIEGGGAGG